ncbi:unnamed protein product [Euphydryas editha]|uniref:Peptidase A2 domain-containing protein n=1 Tax=Euphydryas editha TaxID=104508 RepID=A0AAU9V727_EUPED|nr:unnamed protein product [Euphydryas editha]
MLSSESAGKDCRMIQLFMGDEIRSNLNRSTDDKVQDYKLEPMDVNAVQPKLSKRFCYRCGDRHGGECRFINAQCRYCKKTGHIEKVCILKKKSMRKNINFTEDENDFHLNGIYNFKNEGRIPSFVVHLLLEGIPVELQLDTGASFSLINEHTWRIIQSQRQHLILKPSSLSLRTWTYQ